jgi:hypothetical protein
MPICVGMARNESCFETGSVMMSLRILTIAYIVQAAVGIAGGVTYAIWLHW